MDDITPVSNHPSEDKTASPLPTTEGMRPAAPPASEDPIDDVAVPTESDMRPAMHNEPAENESHEVETSAPVAADAQKKHSPLPLTIGIVTVVVIALAVVAYFAFVKKEAATPAPAAQTTATTTTTTTPETKDAEEVDASIDSSLSTIDESKDYSSTDLSDSTLGL